MTSCWASSGRILSMLFLVTSVNIPAPADAASNWSAPIRSRNASSTKRVKTENNTTKVIDPSAVTSTAALVSHGVRLLATDSKIARSMAPTSPSINSLVMRTNVRSASAAPPNQRERRPARAENKSRLTDSRPLPSSRSRRLLGSGNSDQVPIERNGPVNRGRLISRQPIHVLSCAHDAVVSPDAI